MAKDGNRREGIGHIGDAPLEGMSQEDRVTRVKLMTDEQLLDNFNTLNHPDLIDTLWLPLVEAEMWERGLVKKN
ncbi:hypothetical protein [Pelagibacterium montanilacus]|uniref:hypothetical protein n=1 Tax=Pelagibacterium montanilacus TaxID=2185280 RepID=UPI000F8E363D|nr:hypothetical protein [Pelagibacterium montanilacus]